jgi:hypothetical protein
LISAGTPMRMGTPNAVGLDCHHARRLFVC